MNAITSLNPCVLELLSSFLSPARLAALERTSKRIQTTVCQPDAWGKDGPIDEQLRWAIDKEFMKNLHSIRDHDDSTRNVDGTVREGWFTRAVKLQASLASFRMFMFAGMLPHAGVKGSLIFLADIGNNAISKVEQLRVVGPPPPGLSALKRMAYRDACVINHRG